MAKQINPEKELTRRLPANDRQVWWFDRDSDPFLQSLENKHDAALLLSSELAAWFGDLSSQSPRV